MNRITLAWAALSITPFWAAAQSATPAVPGEPAPAQSSSASAEPPRAAPTIGYESAFKDYRSWRDEPTRPWRDVNDEVRQVGGHAGVLKAAEPGPEPSRAQGDKPAEPQRGHETMHGKGGGHAH